MIKNLLGAGNMAAAPSSSDERAVVLIDRRFPPHQQQWLEARNVEVSLRFIASSHIRTLCMQREGSFVLALHCMSESSGSACMTAAGCAEGAVAVVTSRCQRVLALGRLSINAPLPLRGVTIADTFTSQSISAVQD
jgi:hypothetical protein